MKLPGCFSKKITPRHLTWCMPIKYEAFRKYISSFCPHLHIYFLLSTKITHALYSIVGLTS